MEGTSQLRDTGTVALLAAVLVLPLYFELQPQPASPWVLTAATLAVPLIVAKGVRSPKPWLVPVLGIGCGAFAVFSILTGFGNLLTDEPWTTPRFVGLALSGQDLYTTQLTFWHDRMGVQVYSASYYVYLPLLTFVQVPYLDYRWFSLALWGAVVYLLRNRYYGAIAMACPYPALMAANGFNDFVPLILLTFALVLPQGWPRRVAEILALGVKQFANVLLFGYYLAKKDYLAALRTVVVTLVILLPFLLWDWKAVVCATVLYHPPSCSGPAMETVWWAFIRINYGIYVVWVAAMFHQQLLPWATRILAKVAPFGRGPST